MHITPLKKGAPVAGPLTNLPYDWLIIEADPNVCCLFVIWDLLCHRVSQKKKSFRGIPFLMLSFFFHGLLFFLLSSPPLTLSVCLPCHRS